MESPSMKVLSRDEVALEHTWDMTSIFSSREAWEEAITEVGERLNALRAYTGRLGEGPTTLADFFEGMWEMAVLLGKVSIYASGHHEVDTTDQDAAAMYSRAMGLRARAGAAVAFAQPELLAIGIPIVRDWLQEEPRLAIYGHYLDSLERLAPHVRSAEVEELLGELLDPFRTAESIHGVLGDADLAFEPAHAEDPALEPVPISQGNVELLETSHDRELRRTAFENYADAHLAVKNTMAACLSCGVKHNVFSARARRYTSALEASLSRYHIPVEVFHNTINTFREHLPTWHRYWRLRRDALGYDALHVYDIKAPLTHKVPRVPFQQAVDWICEGLQPLGEYYVETLRRGVLEQRWVDIYPTLGKRSGAFSTGSPGTYPFVLLNYTDDVYGLSTLAHELGHSMHSFLTWETQPYVYANYSIFAAEVPSNLNQAMVRDYLLRTVSDTAFQVALIEEAMSNFHRYFFLMPTLARFELELHQRGERGEALTADGMISLMTDLFREGYGDEVEIDADRVGITWAHFHTHLYSNFYVYQYTTGISAAHSLVDAVASGEGVERYLDFLRAGSSLYPLDALQRAGVDLTSPEPVERTFGYLAGLVDRLENLLLRMRT